MNGETQRPEKTGRSLPWLNNIIFWGVTTLIALLPVLYIPVYGFPIRGGKAVIAIGIIALLAVILFSKKILERRLVLPRYSLVLAGFAVFMAGLLSALASPVSNVSLFGANLPDASFVFLFSSFLLFVIIGSLFQTFQKVFYFYIALIVPFVLLVVFHGARFLFGPNILSLGVFFSAIGTPVGGWYDLAMFFAVIAILALVTIELLSIKKLFRIIALAVLVMSFIFMALVNFTIMWYVLAAVSFIIFLYRVGWRSLTQMKHEKHAIPVVSLIVFLIALIMPFINNPIQDAVLPTSITSYSEVRLSTSGTFKTARYALGVDPVFGVGQDRFEHAWQHAKPNSVLSTQYADVNFTDGIGFLPSQLVTTGIFGLLAWLVFLVLFVRRGYIELITPNEDQISRYFILSSFMVSLFLWIMHIIYIPGPVIQVFAFAFTGLFLGVIAAENHNFTSQISFSKLNPKRAVVAISVVFLLGLSIAGLYFTAAKTVAYTRAQSAGRAETLNEARDKLLNSLKIAESDVNYRSLALIETSRAAQVFATATEETDVTLLAEEVQGLLSEALSYVERAIEFDRTNYLNWVALGDVYTQMTSLQIEGAYDRAKDAYTNALQRSPKNLSIGISLARLEILNGNLEQARSFLQQVLSANSSNIDGLLLAAELELGQENVEDATQLLEQAALVASNDLNLWGQVGILYFNQERYADAAQLFDQILALDPSQHIVRFLFSQALIAIDQPEAALQQLELLEDVNMEALGIDIVTPLNELRSAGVVAPPQAETSPDESLPSQESELTEDETVEADVSN